MKISTLDNEQTWNFPKSMLRSRILIADVQARSAWRELAMKALIYKGPNIRAIENRPKPELIDPGDAIIKMLKTTICGTDLHILKGDVATCTPGRILGHEGVGIVDSVGPAVTAFHKGDHVLISCVSACGKCEYCRRCMYSHCLTGGWILGNKIDGTQAEYVRTPHADTSLYPIPAGVDEEALVMLSDILPIGFATLLTAQFYSPAQIIMIDLDANRLVVAKHFGATDIINSASGRAQETVMEMTQGKGVDTAIEAVGIPATFELCQQIVAAGGTIANIGVHGVPVALHLEKLWDRNISITTRLVDTVSMPMLLKSVSAKKIDAKLLITHRFKFDETLEAYDTFAHAADTKSLKVIIEAD